MKIKQKDFKSLGKIQKDLRIIENKYELGVPTSSPLLWVEELNHLTTQLWILLNEIKEKDLVEKE